MPILCFEGPSAVGKTTTASALAAIESDFVIPEANTLFARSENEAPEWYLERQVERYALAANQARRHSLVVLDGDPFQPLWYNWAYGFAGWQGLDALEAFYRPRLLHGDISFPDLYIVFSADIKVLRERKEADQARRRHRFETHLQFIEPQQRYFAALRRFSPERVRFLDARDVGQSVRAVAAAAQRARAAERSVELFDYLIWVTILANNPQSITFTTVDSPLSCTPSSIRVTCYRYSAIGQSTSQEN